MVQTARPEASENVETWLNIGAGLTPEWKSDTIHLCTPNVSNTRPIPLRVNVITAHKGPKKTSTHPSSWSCEEFH